MSTATAPSQELATKPQAASPAPPKPIAIDDSQFANLLDTVKFDHMWRIAQMYAKTQFVPEIYRGKAEDCFIACQMAIRLGLDPMMFMQNTYIVHGKPGMEAKLAIALINSKGPFTGPLQFTYEGEGMSRACTAFATHSKTGEVCSCKVTMQIAKAEGWIDKSGSKWKTMPDQMLAYRAASWFGRLYCPECLMGMQTVDELEDVHPAKPVENLAGLAKGRVSVRSAPVLDAAAMPVADPAAGGDDEVLAAAEQEMAEVFDRKAAPEAHEEAVDGGSIAEAPDADIDACVQVIDDYLVSQDRPKITRGQALAVLEIFAGKLKLGTLDKVLSDPATKAKFVAAVKKHQLWGPYIPKS